MENFKNIKCIFRTFDDENGIKKMWYSKEYVQKLKNENKHIESELKQFRYIFNTLIQYCEKEKKFLKDINSNDYFLDNIIKILGI